MENKVSEKTASVSERRDARTVLAMRPALVEREAGNEARDEVDVVDEAAVVVDDVFVSEEEDDEGGT